MRWIKTSYRFLFKKHPRKVGIVLFLLFLGYWFALPYPLFDDPTCMILEDKNGNLLGARIAADGQWRFPQIDTVPEKFEKAILTFEDKRFYHHIGFDLRAFLRATQQNISNKKIVSGGSTLTMQTIRLSRKGKPRTIFQKLIEAILATRLEISFSKAEILRLYASYAPFGGNVVGLDAASWRYYNKPPTKLSWAEAATLAVLPNSPALIHPGRNRQQLIAKRNRLIDRLVANHTIDELTAQLAKEEPIPDKPHALPRLAPHLLDRAYKEHFFGKKNQHTRLQTTIDPNLQRRVNEVLKYQQSTLQGNGIHNAAVLVLEIETGNVIAYAGNIPQAGKKHSEQVDIIGAPRSTGSILKPFLYSFMLQEGELLPEQLIEDVPTTIGGYRPENFHQNFDGRVSAKKAISRSLNVPLVKMLQSYTYEKFHYGLNKIGLTTINKNPDHYGLSLILGGAEVNLWDITNAYASMSRTINHFHPNDGRYDPLDFRKPNYVLGKKVLPTPRKQLATEAPFISASAAWLAFEAMRNVERPNSEGDWQSFSSSKTIAWKTGTSFGFRDAWAVGVTPKYAVGVWAGNADGEGRPGLIGVRAAAPILFGVFDLLPASRWFEQPIDEMIEIPVCRQSGYRASPICVIDSLWVPQAGTKAATCPFHQTVHLDKNTGLQVNSDCESPSNMMHEAWFVLDPVEEYYYKPHHPEYQPLPAFRADCSPSHQLATNNPMQLIYPKKLTSIFVPVDLNGELSRTIFKVAHRDASQTIYWHLDDEYIGSTSDFHEMELHPKAGYHSLTLVDEKGFSLERKFKILEK
ncbi:MAG: penicillin-binding protein 1C [Bacteroidota bacterium]